MVLVYVNPPACRPSSGRLRCWGPSGPATEVPQDLGLVTAVVTQAYHTCVITASKAVRCWGQDPWKSNVTVVPPNLGPAVALALTSESACALLESGLVRCWGTLRFGDVPSDMGAIKAIAGQWISFCALTASGDARCWGGDNTLSATGPFIAAAPGANALCFLGASGAVACQRALDNTPLDMSPVVALSVGDLHACALQASGEVRCWGLDSVGIELVPVPPPDLGPCSAVYAGERHTCALNSLNTLRCWGASEAITNVPTDLGSVLTVSIATGQGPSVHVCVILQGELACCT